MDGWHLFPFGSRPSFRGKCVSFIEGHGCLVIVIPLMETGEYVGYPIVLQCFIRPRWCRISSIDSSS